MHKSAHREQQIVTNEARRQGEVTGVRTAADWLRQANPALAEKMEAELLVEVPTEPDAVSYET